MRRSALALVWLACWGCLRPPPERSVSHDGGPAPLEGSEATNPARPPRVIIVGGGLAGLSAAYTLEKEGIPFHLLEGSDVLGGRVQTARYGDGLEAEFGMQEIWRGNPLLDIARDLRVELDGEPEPTYSSIILDGNLYPYVQPTTAAYFSSFLSESEKAALDRWMATAKTIHDAVRKDGLAAPRAQELQNISFAAWLKAEKLPQKVAEWIRITLEVELAAQADQFSALAGLLEFEIFFGGDVPNYHVKGGNTRLIEAMAAALTSPVTRSAWVTGIARETDASGKTRVRVTYLQGHDVKSLEADRAIVAVPFVRVHQIHFEPPLAESHVRAIQGLGLGQYTVVHFLVAKASRALFEVGGESILPVLSDGPLGVIYGVQQPSPDGQPLDVFALLVYGLRARLFHMAPRETKIAELKSELERLWPGFGQHVRGSHVYTHHPAALAVWPPGRSPLDPLSVKLREPDRGVYFAGDYTLGSHSDAAVKSGIAAAQAARRELD